MISISGLYLGHTIKKVKDFEFVEIIIQNSGYAKYPYVVQAPKSFDVSRCLDKKTNIITLNSVFVSAWSERLTKYTPMGVKFSVSNS